MIADLITCTRIVMKCLNLIKPVVFLTAFIFLPRETIAQHNIKDSIVYRIIFKDTIIYRYDTIRIKHFVRADTLWTPSHSSTDDKDIPIRKKRVLNPNNWGIGPSVGAYYSPFNGFDIKIGFGLQYYILSIPSFKNPHMGHRRNKK